MNIKIAEKILRSCEITEVNLNNKKWVESIKGKDALSLLESKCSSDKEAVELLDEMVRQRIIVKCQQTENKGVVKISFTKKFKISDTYIFVESSGSMGSLIFSAVFLFFTMFIALYQLWPSTLKNGATLIIYPTIAFTVLVFIIGILRLIIFAVTFFTHSPGIWIFPNLFADVGIIESFKPLWSYHEQLKDREE